MAPPNVLYVHSHDTGRYVQPYGYPVPTPNIQHLADQGALFRQAFCAAPVCSGSRAALLTGQCTHATGMLGLAHRGYRLTFPERHIAHVLRSAGYWTGLIGEQHVSADPADLGYDRIVDLDSTKVRDVAPAATRLLAERAQAREPFFLSVGFFETHREYFEPSSVRDALYSRPPENIVDTAMTRRDMASFKASARSLDQGVGAVLNALEENDLVGNTLVILTTDHGLAFPDAKATMYDRGIGVMLLMRGPGGFEHGRVFDSIVSHLDLFPTVCEVAGIDPPEWLEGVSLLPLVRGELDELHHEIFAELTYHAAYEPQRAVRTARYKYARRFDDQRPGRVLANVDDSATKDVMLHAGWADVNPPGESLYDLWLDPGEGTNRIDDAALAGVLSDLRRRLHDWMVRTDDPLLNGPVAPAEGTFYNTVEQVSPSDPTTPPTTHSRTLTHRARRGDAPPTTDS
ncbi:MAG: N-sulfoglucosamine sulfohydrolase [Acidimicrobiaceae bacterium]|nr:N-sulfoglucosamine sulfohydrolase [Acidimicrobiaceae bacterium]